MKTKNLSRIIMILMLVLMGSAQAVAQGLKIKRFSCAKSGETLRGEQIYARTDNEEIWERGNGYSPYPWILYLENGGHVQLELPDSQKHQVGPGYHSFTYKNGVDMNIHVNVVPYAVPYLGKLRLQGAISNDSVHLEKTVSEEDFFTYRIKSDASLMQLIKIQSGGGREVNGNKGIYATIIKEFPQGNYRYAPELPHQELFAQGVSVQYLKEQAHNRGLDPNDFVLQIGLDCFGSAAVFSEVYRAQARDELKTTFLRIIDKRPQIKKVTLTTQISPVGAGEVLINGKAQTSITVDQGTEVILEAQASEGYVFSHWKNSEGAQVGTTAKLTYKVEKDETLTAVFEAAVTPVKKSTLSVGVSADGSGSVSINGETQTSITVEQGTDVILEAQANKGYVFSHWKNSEGTQVGTTAKLTYKVEKDETLTAVFDQNTPGVDEVKVLTGQREAILTWDAGLAKSWQIKLYQAGQILGDPIVTQVPRVELGNLSPGQEYRYEIIAIAQGKLDSEAKKATFTTENFNEAEAITPYLKGFSQFRGGQAFDLIWMDVNPTEVSKPIYCYYWQLNETSPKVLLIPDGKQLTLDTNQVGGCLIILIKSGDTLLYEVRYELDK